MSEAAAATSALDAPIAKAAIAAMRLTSAYPSHSPLDFVDQANAAVRADPALSIEELVARITTAVELGVRGVYEGR